MGLLKNSAVIWGTMIAGALLMTVSPVAGILVFAVGGIAWAYNVYWTAAHARSARARPESDD